LVRERGFNGTSVQEATTGAGLTVGAFYAHFADKEELLRQAVEQAMTELSTHIASSAQGREGAAAAAEIAGMYLSERHRDNVRLGCPLPAVVGEAASADEPVRAEWIAGLLQTLKGRVLDASQPEIGMDSALAIVALMVGGQILARATRGTPTSSEILSSCSKFLSPEVLKSCKR
jgi:TetR/AcrR family transcriptional repressor of nem operon